MAKMNNKTRQSIVEVCCKHGFVVRLKSDGSDNYAKNLMFRSRHFESDIYIHRDTGIKSSGDMSYLKVAVHPKHFDEAVIDSAVGVVAFTNNRTKINQHFSSNYVDFPMRLGNDEPWGKCYKVDNLDALERLLSGLKK